MRVDPDGRRQRGPALARVGLTLVACLMVLGTLPATAAQPACPARPEAAAVAFVAEVAGARGFERSLPNGWTFALIAADKGWDLRVYDGDGVDLTAGTPPLQGPNPRDLYGWHFRNADNTAPNDGSVNAPQGLRLFTLDPGLSAGSASAAVGQGSLEILEQGLTDLAPGEQARLVYLLFQACLDWPGGVAAIAAETPALDPAAEERMAACGLPPAIALAPFLSPSSLTGDFDGDGRDDLAIPAERRADGKRALAVCLGDGSLTLVGLQGRWGELEPAYFDRMDWWALTEPGLAGLGAGGGAPPTLVGNGIVIGIEGASSVLLYWQDDGFAAYWQGD